MTWRSPVCPDCADRVVLSPRGSQDIEQQNHQNRTPDPADRLVWAAGDAGQCDLWFPPKRIPLEDGSAALLPVLVIVAAHSRFITGRMLPTRKTEDLLLGSWELIQRLGRVPRRLIWDNEAGIGRGGRLAAGVSAFTARWRRRSCSCRRTTRSPNLGLHTAPLRVGSCGIRVWAGQGFLGRRPTLGRLGGLSGSGGW